MTVLLFTHITFAIATLVVAAFATANLKAKKAAAKSMRAMWYSFGGIVLTGLGLFVVNPSSLGHLCALTAVYAAVLSSVRLYSKKVESTAVGDTAL